MKLTTSLIISLLAIIAVAAEMVLYWLCGFTAAVGGEEATVSAIANVFGYLMVTTGAVALFAPGCALVEHLAKKKNLGIYLLIGLVGLTFLFIVAARHEGKRQEAQQLRARYQAQIQAPTSLLTPQEQDQALAEFEKLPPNRQAALVEALEAWEKEEKEFDVEEAKVKYFLNHLTFTNLRVERNVLGSVEVSGEVKNIGEKTIRELRVIVVCEDRNGQEIFQDSFYVVRVPSWASDESELLRPNYAKKFHHYLSDAPSGVHEVLFKFGQLEFLDEDEKE